MTDTRHREKFDQDRDFVVHRSFLMSGEEFPPGLAFNKALVDLRRLRQLYDQRYLRMEPKVEAVETEPEETVESKPFPKARFERAKLERVTLEN